MQDILHPGSPSVRGRTYLAERMFAALKHRLAAAADLAVEAGTLGEYGLGPDGFVELQECPPAPLDCDQSAPLRRSSSSSQRTGSGFFPSVEPSSSTKRRNSSGSATRSSMRAKPFSSSFPLRRIRRQSE
jgi:hypothetical protein